MKRYKYPRTMHLPFSLGATSDDKMLDSCSQFIGKEVVVTLKMDGENSNLYRDYYHARSMDSNHHESRTWLKKFHSEWAWRLIDDERICGENMFAKHSIAYNDLSSYFYAFSYWLGEECVDWDLSLLRFEELGLDVAPTLYRGVWDENVIKALWSPMYGNNEMEGFVVRTVEGFHINEFQHHVAKFVREKHVQTDKHWAYAEIVPNKLI